VSEPTEVDDPGAPVAVPARRAGGRGRAVRFRRWSWFVIAALVLVALARTWLEHGSPRTDADRIRQIDSSLKCPVCEGQSVANSTSAAANAIRAEVTKRVAQGQSDAQIRAAIASTYGSDIQLTPSASGFAGLVWILPVVALVAALAVLSATFARWRRAAGAEASAADHALVDEALRER
jgi:cytochrome c-type biogenesis protein CcmH